MKKIVFMCTTKPYDYYNTNIQLNAINSWLNLDIEKTIVINSSDSQNNKYFGHIKDVKILPIIRQTPTGVPYVKDIFESGYPFCEKDDTLCYVNADIILQNDLITTIKSIDFNLHPNYLIAGQRLSWKDENEFLKVQKFPIDIDVIKNNGSFDPTCATDYFVHNKELYKNKIPNDMILGRCNWDMWLNFTAIKNKASTINITKTCTAIHPAHKYGDKKTKWEEYQPTIINELKQNRKYASHHGHLSDYHYETSFENGKIIVQKIK